MIGIISDRKLRRLNWIDEAQDVSHVYYPDNSMKVKDVMINKIHALHTYNTLSKGSDLFLSKHIGAVPVLDKKGDLVGMLSAINLFRAFDGNIDDQKKGGKK